MRLSRWTIPALLYPVMSVVGQTLTETCPDPEQADYDFIVIGSGSGGGPVAARLAEANFKVLVVEVGGNTVNINTTAPAYFARGTDDPALALAYSAQEYPAGFRYQKSVWYPRGGTLGGSTMINAQINNIAVTKTDFDNIAKQSGDSSWTRVAMQKYYNKMTGIGGWLSTGSVPVDVFLKHPKFLDLQAIFALLGLTTSLPALDINNSLFDGHEGSYIPSFTTNSSHMRSSIHSRLVAVQQQRPQNLEFAVNTLATQVMLCGSAARPKAFGVKISQGAVLPVTASFRGKSQLAERTVTARHEVIVAAGAYQSPQLLMLSGIGDRAELSRVGLNTLVERPGVGKNLQDHDEVTMIWEMKSDFALFEGCKFLSDPAQDPCLAAYLRDRSNLYSFGPAIAAITSTSPNRGFQEPDIHTFFSPASYRGIVPEFAQDIASHPNTISATILKAHSSTKGTVRLTGSHPQDPLDIMKNRFQAPNGAGTNDVTDMVEAAKRARKIMNGLLIRPFVSKEVFPGDAQKSDTDLEKHIYENIFGHHACCTNAMGPVGDRNAVIDSEFQVYGVDSLRVVDMSSWANVPGYFVSTATYMLSEKAADSLIQAAKN